MINDALGSLSIQAVCKTYPGKGQGTQAVDRVSFGLERGEVGILLGPSGCGKSTVLRMTAGLESITGGQICVSGRQVRGPGQDRGLVFQSYTSFPWLTVEQNVAYGLRINGASSRLKEGVVQHYLNAIGLSRFRQHYPDQLSGGMRQRVAIARALANEPDLLLLDEPFGALDPETRQQMQALVLNIVRKEKMTVLMVTHDVDEALYMGDHIAFLSSHPGRLREWISPGFGHETAAPDRGSLQQKPAYRGLHERIMGMMRDESVPI
ncbi:MAG: ABC transporter ATP-binding protein [Halomonadaceae bacterium]|nr:MAG: ABC transporter ATP-binding protein [Halomonadaceae bacterium]